MGTMIEEPFGIMIKELLGTVLKEIFEMFLTFWDI